MTEKLSEFGLHDRPKFRFASWLKWLSFIAFALAVVIVVISLFIGYEVAKIPTESEASSDALIQAVAALLRNLGNFLISTGFYALMLWIASKAVDYLDQLVWLNATDEDRRKIISQRTK